MRFRSHAVTTLLLGSAVFPRLGQMSAQAGVPVTETQLRKLLIEKERVVILLDKTDDLYWAIEASSVGAISNNTLDVMPLAKVIIVENKIVVVGGTQRVPTSKDILEAVKENWREPFDVGKAYWTYSDRSPMELILVARGKYADPRKIEVKEIVTWWCPKTGPTCHNPS